MPLRSPLRLPSLVMSGAGLLGLACRTSVPEGADTWSGVSVGSPGAESETDGGPMEEGSSTSGPGSGSGSCSGEDGTKFDLGAKLDLPEGEEQGCKKVDFLFVVDNSGSMGEEQAALIKSFPGFIGSIDDTVQIEDHRIMVVDTDAASDELAPPPPDPCDATLGGGLTKDTAGESCGVAGGNRYMIAGQPDLTTTFECLARRGVGGDGTERPMQAMVEALTTLDAPGECNDGFVRDDAILVVTYMTDEEDDGKSLGDLTTWKAALVDAKGGNESAIVVLGLVQDADLENGICTVTTKAAPNLRAFAESFEYGSWASICEPDYAPFFDEAVMVIDHACDEFDPAG